MSRQARSPVALVVEAARSARSQAVFSAVTALVVAAVVAVVLATTGQSAAAESQVLSRIDTAGARTIEITDSGGAGAIRTGVLPVIAALRGAASVTGLGVPVDGRNHAIGDGATPVGFWPVFGAVPGVVDGRAPQVGEAVVGVGALARFGGIGGYGAVDLPGQRQAAVVGTVRESGALSFLDTGGALVMDVGVDAPVQRVVIVAATTADVAPLIAAAVPVIGAADPASIRVTSPAALARLQAAVAGDLGGFGRGLLVAVLGAGLLLIAITVAGAVLVRRKDLGRRRALGATRGTVVALVVGQCACAAVPGAALGALVGLAITWRVAGALPGAGFVAGTVVLTLLGAVLAALPAGFSAALRDPITVLRTP